VRSVGVAIRTSHPLSRTRDLDLVLDLADWDLPFPSTLDGEGVHRSSGSVSELLRARVFLVRRELIKGLNLPPIPSSSTYLPLPPLPSSSTTLYLPLPPTFLFHHYLPLPPLFHLPSSSTYLPLPPLFHLPSSSSTTFLFHHYLPLPPLFHLPSSSTYLPLPPLFHLPSSSTTLSNTEMCNNNVKVHSGHEGQGCDPLPQGVDEGVLCERHRAERQSGLRHSSQRPEDG